jgi:hypothetical protein
MAVYIEQHPFVLSIVRFIHSIITREPFHWKKCICYRDESNNYKEFYDNNIVITNIAEFIGLNKVSEKEILCGINKFPLSSEIIEKNIHYRFLSIQYRTDDEIVDIEIDNSFYVQGNEILSSLFVERYCKQYHPSIKFNYNYALIIIDYQLKETILSGNQYIVLEKDTYQVKNL